MLSLLHIENIAVIEQAEITFDKGFNVLTGETGAGKSIVIDAISAILGERTYRDVIRTGADKAFVSAVFTGVAESDWFTEFQVPYQPEELLVQREIFLDGKNICRVNGRPVTVAVLRKLGQQLIQIHGQHDSQQLFDETAHLAFLDAFAENQAQRQTYGEAYAVYAQLGAEMARLRMDESEKLRRMEMLRHQVQELERAALQPGEAAALEDRRRLLQNAEKLQNGLDDAMDSLYGDESSDGAEALLSQSASALQQLGRFDPAFEELARLATDLMYQVQDLTGQVRQMRDGLTYSEAELEQVESRLSTLQRILRKYGPEETDALGYLERAKQELDQIEFADERLAQLQQQRKAQFAVVMEAARALHETRAAAAQTLSERICSELQQLDMPRVSFVCDFTEIKPDPTGIDQVRFLMSANAGEALKPLSRVASGGELARIMLAIKNVMAEKDAIETLIFDEVDAGVSGRAAQRVAEKLSQVARTKQVLCVTHLPQIAAMAGCHLQVSKSERSGRTYTAVQQLDFEGRKRELARLIGGAQITQTTLSSAAEMLRH